MLAKGEEGFFNACDAIANLQKSQCIFSMTSQDPSSVGDRLYFHMYFIHKNEESNKLYNGSNYGAEAFQTNSTSLEKTRCAQRTLVELLLQKLEESIRNKDTTAMCHYLKDLEEMTLDGKDLPDSAKNPAYELFSILYSQYLKAWEQNSQLVHPHNEAFKGDFGRVAFENSGKFTIDLHFKLGAIAILKQNLQQAWKI